MAAYLLTEVLERQSEKVRRLLLCTSVCERVNGELADLLTGDSGGKGIWTTWSGPARSWSRWIRGDRGSATTTCSPAYCSLSCVGPGQVRWPHCTVPPLGGAPRTGRRPSRSGTPGQRWTGTWPAGCCSALHRG